MTNGDKYLKDGVDVEELCNDLRLYNYKIKGATDYYTRDLNLRFLKEFLNQPINPTLTEDERVILRNIDKEIQYITRDRNSHLFIAQSSCDMLALPFMMYDSLFQFIQPRRRI